MRAGVSAYIVDGLSGARVKSIVDVAVARFEEYQRVLGELAEANLKLSERTLVDRAKGILMKNRGLNEEEAYHALRKLAMSSKKRMGDVAQSVIDTADLFRA